MKVTISRKAHFNAAHRLNNPNWSNEKNKAVFGNCNNEFYHGHNYEFVVSVRGKIDPETGYVMDIKQLADLVKDKIEKRFDHKNLNLQTEEFKDLNPTAENIAVVMWNILRDFIPLENDLKITLFETERNFVEYAGD